MKISFHLASKLPSLARGLGIGAVGGLILDTVHAPLPWMLGSMLSTSVAAFYGVRIYIPRTLRNAFVPILGVMFGSAIDMQLLPNVETLAALGAAVTAYFALTIGLGCLYFRITGLDRTSSFFASIPGNFSEVIVVAEAAGADIRSVALMHAARLVIVIPAISFGLQWILSIDLSGTILSKSNALDLASVAALATCGVLGYALAAAIRMPAPQMFGPLILSMLAHTYGIVEGSPPLWAVAGAQVLLGTFAGARFSGVSFLEVARLFLVSVVWAILLLLMICGFTAVVAQVMNQSTLAVFLAFSPGGFAEVSMIAVAAGLSLGLISTAHFLRMFAVILLIPLIVKLWHR